MTVRHLDMAPAFERREQHKQIGGAVALILVINTARPSRLHRDRHARFGDELLGRLVQADQHLIGIMWPHIDGQHVLHRGYKGAVGLRRDDPTLPAMGFETVFLSVRPIVESLARSTIPSSTTLFSSSRSVHRTYPCGGLERSAWPPSRRRICAALPASHAACGSELPRTPLPPIACARGRPWKHLVSKATMILSSLQPSLASETSAFNRMRALSSRRAGPLPLRISVSSCSRSSTLNRTTYFFTEISFPAMIAPSPNHGSSESFNPFKLVETGD